MSEISGIDFDVGDVLLVETASGEEKFIVGGGFGMNHRSAGGKIVGEWLESGESGLIRRRHVIRRVEKTTEDREMEEDDDE